MEHCPHCSAASNAGSKFCASCGSPMMLEVATAVAPDVPFAKAASPRSASAAPVVVGDGRFIPGTLLAGRYRLVALLGRGGMGEVYRAEDTRLGQTVALKFLPDALERDPEMLERFYAEVRIGRQVSHPNVCRLHDLIEVEGHHCLSMEYVDGEDLSVLLTRIGRLPADKAIDIARDLCAGLAAAHDKGVIHRDLKPANVMIDGKGRARIADFGVAALADRIDREALAGTPAYMAPELMDGQPASQRSDIYALGLVLFELCTGKRRFQARSMAELRELHNAAQPLSLSDSARDIPLALERVVLRCLERDPLARPESALAVMAALPGGDPLQAALAAGETPSPAMVAAASQVGAVSTPVAWALLLCACLGLVVLALVAASSTVIGRVHPEKSPEVLSERAREILVTLGYDQVPRDTHANFTYDEEYLADIAKNDLTPLRWQQMADARPGPLHLVYRQSQGALAAMRTLMRPFGPGEVGRVTRDDPPTNVPGMIDVVLDQHGRLLGLRALPSAVASDAVAAEPDWKPLLSAGGLEIEALQPTTPRVRVPVDSDHRVAWEGSYPNSPVKLRIEAAALAGRPVWFGVQGPWAADDLMPLSVLWRGAEQLSPTFRIAIWTVLISGLLSFMAMCILVRRNLRLGRGDRRSALRLSSFLLVTALIAQWLRTDHVALVFEEAATIVNQLAQAVLYAAIAWMTYMALEPLARRRWPQLLVGWTRLMDLRWRDPLVGRDILIGVLGGIVMTLALHLAIVAPPWFGVTGSAPFANVMSTVDAYRHLLFYIFWSPYAAFTIGFGTLLALLVNRAIVRHQGVALAILTLTLYFGFAVFTGIDEVWSLARALFTLIYVALLLRAGLLAAVVSFYAFLLLQATPLTADVNAWYADRSLTVFALLGGLLAYGFKICLAGKPMFGSLLLEPDER